MGSLPTKIKEIKEFMEIANHYEKIFCGIEFDLQSYESSVLECKIYII